MKLRGRKNENRGRSKKSPLRGKGPALAALLICVLLVLIVIRLAAGRSQEDVKKGVQYLQKVDSDEALAKNEKEFKDMQAQELSALLTEASKDGGDSSFDPWSYFNDSVIMGDSRAVGFYVFDYLPQNRVLAEAGNTIQTISESMDTLRSLNPAYIFLCYGLNDVTSGRWDSAEAWISDYDKEIQKLVEAFPDATIVVNSILPVAEDRAVSTNKRVTQVPEYEEAISQYCAEHHVVFVNCDEVAAQHEDMITEDGIHYHRNFYTYWAGEMIVTAYMGDDGQETGENGQ